MDADLQAKRLTQLKKVHEETYCALESKYAEYIELAGNGSLVAINDEFKKCLEITPNGIILKEHAKLHELLVKMHIFSAMYVMSPKIGENILDEFDNIHDEAFELFRAKNADYGDAFADFGVVGILVRLNDKLRRILSITESGQMLVKCETIQDTYMDMNNYSAMALMLLTEYLSK